MLPPTWGDGCGAEEIEDGWDIQDADVLIVDSDPVYGPGPHAVQGGGCGDKGERITIQTKFLTNYSHRDDVLKGKFFAKEWVKYKFGVFDEFGFPNDLLYLNKFNYEGEILPTGTANSKVMGTWVSFNGVSCDPSKHNCLFLPLQSNPSITCSLGNLFFLPNVHTWCRPNLALGPEGPTKQKVICTGRTTMEIISNHEEFVQLSSKIYLDEHSQNKHFKVSFDNKHRLIVS